MWSSNELYYITLPCPASVLGASLISILFKDIGAIEVCYYYKVYLRTAWLN